ncbi:ion channel protein [Streptomyces fuscigenes]|nr:ion channel protein [Streptomyces fuscigenes]MCF3961950.1 ion channel protein [Streptomyces fuscigenes]
MATDPPSPRALLSLVVPALVVGILSALVLIGVSDLAEQLEDVLWDALPGALGIGRYSTAWMVVMLTATGLAVGLVVRFAPGGAGPDPATTALVDPPLGPRVLPGLLAVTVLALAGGVSLGPENPITATNIALVYWLGRRAVPRAPDGLWLPLAAAGTVGALFGTPVAAALILTETIASQPAPGSLWDKLFGPLVAGGAGALTTSLIAKPSFDLDLPRLHDPGWGDLLAALVTASAGAVLGLAAVYALPWAHRAFRLLPGGAWRAFWALGAGGAVLGLLGALGGHLTLFKGLSQVKTLADDPNGWSAGSFALMAAVKLAAVVVASACGFRGGRIFPAIFAGVSLGLCAHALVGQVDVTLAVACTVLGVLLAVTRLGWLSLFTAAVLASDTEVLPLLCVAMLPAWLLVTGRPLMQLADDGSPRR